MNLYIIYDRKAEVANPPFTAVNHAFAIRQFQMQVNQPSTPERVNVLRDYAEDFQLIFVGNMDEKSCRIEQPEVPTLLCTAIEMLKD